MNFSDNVNQDYQANKMNLLISSESSASISNVNRNILANYRNRSQEEPEDKKVEI